MSVQILSPTEVRISGRKFLYNDSNLYTIRDRESDADYDEDEEWSFVHWAGPQVHELSVLQQWITHLCSAVAEPQQQQQPQTQQKRKAPPLQPQRRTERWIGHGDDAWAIAWISGVDTGSLMVTNASMDVLWMTEYTAAELVTKAEADGFVGTPAELVDTIHWGIHCPAFTPQLLTQSDGTVRVELAYDAAPNFGLYTAYFFLNPTQLPPTVFSMLTASLGVAPAPPPPTEPVLVSPVTMVETASPAPSTSSPIPERKRFRFGSNRKA